MSNSKNNRTVFVAYVPVLHDGYRLFFESHPQIKTLFIVQRVDNLDIDSLKKDVRFLDSQLVKKAIQSWERFEKIEILDKSAIAQLQQQTAKIIMPDEDVSHVLAKKHFSKNEVEFSSIFLRWNKRNVEKTSIVNPSAVISENELDQKMMALAFDQATKSGDWWRSVGCVVFKNQQVLFTSYNQDVPSPHQSYFDSNPRNIFSKGENIEMAVSIHAEASTIAQAAKKGDSLDGASMYVTTFPCPVCAKLIAASGIKKLIFADGYSVLDGEKVLKSANVEIIRVKMAKKSQLKVIEKKY